MVNIAGFGRAHGGTWLSGWDKGVDKTKKIVVWLCVRMNLQMDSLVIRLAGRRLSVDWPNILSRGPENINYAEQLYDVVLKQSNGEGRTVEEMYIDEPGTPTVSSIPMSGHYRLATAIWIFSASSRSSLRWPGVSATVSRSPRFATSRTWNPWSYLFGQTTAFLSAALAEPPLCWCTNSHTFFSAEKLRLRSYALQRSSLDVI